MLFVSEIIHDVAPHPRSDGSIEAAELAGILEPPSPDGEARRDFVLGEPPGRTGGHRVASLEQTRTRPPRATLYHLAQAGQGPSICVPYASKEACCQRAGGPAGPASPAAEEPRLGRSSCCSRS